MEDKQALEVEGGKRIKSSHLGISLVFLSLTVAATVAALIFMSVHVSYQTKVAETSPKPQPWYNDRRGPAKQRDYTSSEHDSRNDREKVSTKEETHMKVRNEDGTEVEETVEYDESRDLAIFHGSDGSFLAEDFDKGINIIKDPDSGDCYVVPVGTNKTAGKDMKNFIKTYGGQEVDVETEQTYAVEVLPGAIEDTSFLPREAEAECGEYHWLSIVGKDDGALDESRRVKRQTCTRCYYYLVGYFYRNGRWYARYRYVCIRYRC